MTVGEELGITTSNGVVSDIFKEKLVVEWDCDDVYSWLIDGLVLLSMKEADLRNPPLSLTCFGDIKKLSKALVELRTVFVKRFNQAKTSDTPPIVLTDEDANPWLFNEQEVHQCSYIIQNGEVVEKVHERQITATATNLENDTHFKLITKEELIRRIESPDTQTKSLFKLLVAFLYCSISLLITSFVMVIVHDRVPDMNSYPPLPDLILNNLPLIPWAFEACEFIGSRDHKKDVLRRGNRVSTSMHNYVDHFTFSTRNAFGMFGKNTPETWYGLHTISWVLNLFGMFFILAGHEHYSIDVFIAFYISSRMFLYYHAYAYNHLNITSTDSRMRLWFPLGWFFESGGNGRVDNEFGEPFSLFIPSWSRRGSSDTEILVAETRNVQEAIEVRQKKTD